MCNLRRKDLIWETLDARIGKIFDINAAVRGISKRLMTWSTFFVHIETIVTLKLNNTMEVKNYSTNFMTDYIDSVESILTLVIHHQAVQTSWLTRHSVGSCREAGKNGVLAGEKLKGVKRHLHFSKSSEDKHDSRLESIGRRILSHA